MIVTSNEFLLLLMTLHNLYIVQLVVRVQVIHAGIYYRPGSLIARLCTRGKELMYDYARGAGVPHLRIGKLVGSLFDANDVLWG